MARVDRSLGKYKHKGKILKVKTRPAFKRSARIFSKPESLGAFIVKSVLGKHSYLNERRRSDAHDTSVHIENRLSMTFPVPEGEYFQ